MELDVMERAIAKAFLAWHQATDHRKYIPKNLEQIRWQIAEMNGAYDGQPWSFRLENALER